MRNAWLVLAALLACACARVDSAAPTTDTSCISSTTYSAASRSYDLGVKDSTIDSNAGGLRLAQSFLTTGDTTTTLSVTSIKLPLYSVGTLPSGTITLKLFTNSGSSPGTAVSGTTATLSQTSISTTLALATFTFNAPVSLTGGTTYWIVLDATYGQTNSPVLKWAADDVASGNTGIYTNGVAKYEYDGTAGNQGTWGNGTMSSGTELGFLIECN